MAGIQISGLLSNSAFDWKSVVDQLVAASGIPIKKLEAEKVTNTTEAEALAGLETLLTDLKDAVQTMRADEVFAARTVVSDLDGTTWKSSSVTGAAIGSYEVGVSQLATLAQLRGTSDIGSGLATTSDVSGLTLANLSTAAAVTAGTFTVAGKQVTVATTDSLQDVFNAISTATGSTVTAAYDPAEDKVTLTKASGELLLGAANDTSNFLSVMKLTNGGGAAATSTGALGSVKASATLANAGLRASITAVDGDGNGTFSINGVAIAFNANTDSLAAVINRINGAEAGVTAAYDPTKDRVVLTNKSTGDLGISVSEADGGLLDALGLSAASSGTFVHGKNALFTINGGDVISSVSNTLDETVHGIEGLSVTVNSETTQTLQIESDIATMQSAIEGFIEKFNAIQTYVEENTKVTISGASVSTSVLSNNREVQTWADELRKLAFGTVSGVTGDLKQLEHLGIDFDGTTGLLKIKNSAKLATALGDKPDQVESLFSTPTTGLVGRFYSYLATVSSADRKQQANLSNANAKLDEQISTLQARLESEREQLTTSFMRMLDAQSSAQGQNTYLTNMFFKDKSS
jgi:flagellar hook-associated protein 2